MPVGPSKGWSARRAVEPPNTGSHTAEYLCYRRSDRSISGTVTSPGCLHQGLRSPGVWISALLRGMWVDGCSLFSFLLSSSYLSHLGFQLVYILKPLFLDPSCCTVTLSVLQMNEKPPLKLDTIQCLSFSGTTFGFF